MKRWNGWGEESTLYPLPAGAADYLEHLVGAGPAFADLDFEAALRSVPDSRLPPDARYRLDPATRLTHARGQSLPDWIALRSGLIGTFPDAVAFPKSDEAVRDLLDLARSTGLRLIPYGGGTSVVGHINPLPGDSPVITLDLSRWNGLLALDEISQLATFGAGVRGPDLEQQLNARGFTLGHYPQSFEFSTLGGWIATRSSGQQSYHYGRIEQLFAGGHVETLLGPLDLPLFPASAAGPDLRHLILGSEGRLGILTTATVRIRRRPEAETFSGVFFHEWEAGTKAVREIAQARLAVSMLRLSDPTETVTTLALAGRQRLVAWADRGLRLASYGPGRCLLILGLTGSRAQVDDASAQVGPILRRHGGFWPIAPVGKLWRKSRFLSPYLRNTLWDRGYALDTLETALPWSAVIPAAEAITRALRESLAVGGFRALVFSHLSHVYADGASIYVTSLFPRGPDPEALLHRWQQAKSAASRVILAHHGTISHQHGVGLDHMPYLPAEKGTVGMRWLRSVIEAADPTGVLNPGKLLVAGAGDTPPKGAE